MIHVEKYNLTTRSDDDSGFNIAEGLDDLFARQVRSHEDLMVYIHNILIPVRRSRQREKGFLGRLWNRAFKEELERVAIEGVPLRQLFDLAGESPSEEIEYNVRYLVSFADLQRMKEDAERVLTHKLEDGASAFRRSEAKRARSQ